MARMIDGDKLVENLRLIDTCWSISPFVSKEKHNGAVDMLREVEREVKEAPTLTPPNDPLTLEQLRQMDGRPVWIVEHPDWGHWELSADAEDYIADRDQDLYGLKHDDPAGQCGLHVLGWLAYRRPPEGEEDT